MLFTVLCSLAVGFVLPSVYTAWRTRPAPLTESERLSGLEEQQPSAAPAMSAAPAVRARTAGGMQQLYVRDPYTQTASYPLGPAEVPPEIRTGHPLGQGAPSGWPPQEEAQLTTKKVLIGATNASTDVTSAKQSLQP